MSLAVFLAVLAAAALHAGWNAVVKAAPDKAMATRHVAIGAGFVGLLAVPFVDPPAIASLPWLAASVALQVVYFLLLARAYRLADLSVVYPVMRGLAPLFVAAISGVAFGEAVSPIGVAGVAAIGLGLFGLIGGRALERRGVATAITTGAVIAGYTVLDGVGVRLSGSPLGWAAWEAILTSLPFLVREAFGDAAHPAAERRTAALFGLLGGLATTISWAVALWAMTLAPIAVVAALRETSIVFALLLGRILFAEPIGLRHAVSVAIVLAGMVALRLA